MKYLKSMFGSIWWWIASIFSAIFYPVFALRVSITLWKAERKLAKEIKKQPDEFEWLKKLLADIDPNEVNPRSHSNVWEHAQDLAGFNSDALLDADSPREAQIKLVLRQCKPGCYHGDFPIVEVLKLHDYMQTSEAMRMLDADLYSDLVKLSTNRWLGYRSNLFNPRLDSPIG